MKKILIAFMLLAVLVVPMFAEEETMAVQTVVNLIEDFAFTTQEYTDASVEIGNKISTVQDINGNNTFYVAIRTNAHKSYKITLTHEDLKLVGGDGNDTIALKVNGNNSGTQIVVLSKGAEKNLRKYAEDFNVTYDSADYAAATVGTYQATITMTITPND